MKRFTDTTSQTATTKRYIDDIMMDTNEELKQLLRARNDFNPSLQFTYTYSQNSIDLTIYKGPNISYIHPYTGHKDITATPEPLPIYTIPQTTQDKYIKQSILESV